MFLSLFLRSQEKLPCNIKKDAKCMNVWPFFLTPSCTTEPSAPLTLLWLVSGDAYFQAREVWKSCRKTSFHVEIICVIVIVAVFSWPSMGEIFYIACFSFQHFFSNRTTCNAYYSIPYVLLYIHLTKRNTRHLQHIILSFSLCCTYEYKSGCAELCRRLSLTKPTGAFSIRAIWANDMLWNSCCYRFLLMVWAVTLILSLKRGRWYLKEDDLDVLYIVLSSVFCSHLWESVGNWLHI